MKKLLIILCFVSAFSACKKGSDPEPDAGAKVAGTYQLSMLSQGGASVALPVTTGGVTVLSGSIIATRKDANTVNLKLTLKQAGEADFVDEGEATLKDNGSGYDLLDGADKVGTADGSTLTFEISDGTDNYTLTAKK